MSEPRPDSGRASSVFSQVLLLAMALLRRPGGEDYSAGERTCITRLAIMSLTLPA